MSRGDELELRRRFAEAHDVDAMDAPSFESVRQSEAAARRKRPARVFPAAFLAATAVIAAVVLLQMPERRSSPADEAIAQASELSSWTAPTDAWLALSGLEIPDSVPSLSPSSVTTSGELQ